jgi:peptidoglycan/xylan/chitin deacetylase (PgdA/CDA1 family)
MHLLLNNNMKSNLTILASLLYLGLLVSCGNTPEMTQVQPNEEEQLIVATEEVLPAAMPDDSTKRVLYLTFDDGPMQGTSTVINILEQHSAPATFFLIGLHAAQMPTARENMQRLRNNPRFELCNHSYTHAYRNRYEKFYTDPEGAVGDFNRAQDSLRFTNNIVRTPGNNMWRTEQYIQNTMKRYTPTAEALAQNGYRLAGWDAEWMHYKQKLKQSAVQMKQQIDNAFAHSLNRAQGHCILLMHDATFHDPIDSASLVQLISMVQADTNYRMSVMSRHPFFRSK